MSLIKIPSRACSGEGNTQPCQSGLLLADACRAAICAGGAHALDMRIDFRKSSAMMAALVFTCASVARRLECTWKSPLASGQMKFRAAKMYAVFLAASCKGTWCNLSWKPSNGHLLYPEGRASG